MDYLRLIFGKISSVLILFPVGSILLFSFKYLNKVYFSKVLLNFVVTGSSKIFLLYSQQKYSGIEKSIFTFFSYKFS